ncbi:hypothetical protein NDU88_007215 [Pleurodeles waltl]|uniref:Uncharacterized protein n=1 Tax=Pleurodeles waltl TaxID=8319 RepID=A0AAV7VRV7_PLEWA|nr:hypothetical protein NDU88_007215 [Pleurodeles waltl]
MRDEVQARRGKEEGQKGQHRQSERWRRTTRSGMETRSDEKAVKRNERETRMRNEAKVTRSLEGGFFPAEEKRTTKRQTKILTELATRDGLTCASSKQALSSAPRRTPQHSGNQHEICAGGLLGRCFMVAGKICSECKVVTVLECLVWVDDMEAFENGNKLGTVGEGRR